MITFLALIFVGFILVGVFLNLYYLAFCAVAGFLVGLENQLVLNIAYWVCVVAGVVTAFYIMRKAWPTKVAAKQPSSDQSGP
jgi:hypothetical protein